MLTRRYLREWSVCAALALLLAVLAVQAPRFFAPAQLLDLAVSRAALLVAAVGMTLVIVARQIDVSVGASFAVCSVLAGLLAKSGLPVAVVIPLTIIAGALCGALNGALVARLGLPAIVVTLATMFIVRESLRWVREGETVRGLETSLQWFGLGQTAGQWAILGVAALVTVLFAVGLRWVAAGRAVYAVGSDPDAARLAGLRPRFVVFGCFAALGALTGLAALLDSARLADIDPNAGGQLELQVIAAVVVGGAAVTGGRGTIIGTLLGVALLGVIGTALTFLGVSPHWEKAVQGAIILLAVAADALTREGR